MPAPETIIALVEKFHHHLAAYKQNSYNEAQLRIEFLNPMFAALGWDIDNTQGYAAAYKEVTIEDSVKISGVTKAPDYAFRIGGVRKFFLEAKKPSVNIQEDVHPAYQLRRYAWSAKLPLSILSDFEEFAVYDCRIKPDKGDPASTARVMYLRYTDFVARWDEIAGVFGKEAILKGAFDQYAESHKAKRGTAEVDTAFLGEIERWRELLARNLALRNRGLSARELNFAVQQTIDRIIFLRICEDRGIEPYGELMGLQNGTQVYARMVQKFLEADRRYNSGLFHFSDEKGQSTAPDTLTPSLTLDDKVLKDIFKHLYYPDSPYEFSVLPGGILGQVYERFLGKVVRITPARQVKIEEKPEVIKAGGVVYTPAFIAETIVRQVLDRLLAGKTATTATKLRLLDMACGSGIFLITLYQVLLDWHLAQYTADNAEKWARGRSPRLYRTQLGEWRLTLEKRKRILLDHVYGVDIDAQAVEVTKLSLLLKLLEGEDRQTLDPQLALLPQRILPDLSQNIRCGNALIGPEFYEGQMALLDEEEAYRINVFDWRAAFPEVFAQGGFDGIVGNPPYVRMETFKSLKTYLKTNYACHDERSDLYAYFIEKAHKLLREGGLFGMIVSNKFLRANYGAPLRSFLSQNAILEQIVDLAGLPVFVGATVRTIILISRRGSDPSHRFRYAPPLPVERFNSVASGSLALDEAIADNTFEISSDALNSSGWSFQQSEHDDLITRLQAQSVPLARYGDGLICMGVKSGLTEAFVIDKATAEALLAQNPEASEIIKPLVNGRDVRRYQIEHKGLNLIYTHHGVDIRRYPSVEQHLKPYKDALQKRATKQEWYELQQPQLKFAAFMAAPKIIFPDIATTPRFALDDVGYFGSNTTYFIPRRDLYLLGLLNSRLGGFYFRAVCAGLEGKNETYLRFFGQYLERFPVRTIDFTDPADAARHARMVALVEQMLALHRRRVGARTPHEQSVLAAQIAATDRQIDRLVYELYGLTKEEIEIVEGGQR